MSHYLRQSAKLPESVLDAANHFGREVEHGRRTFTILCECRDLERLWQSAIKRTGLKCTWVDDSGDGVRRDDGSWEKRPRLMSYSVSGPVLLLDALLTIMVIHPTTGDVSPLVQQCGGCEASVPYGASGQGEAKQRNRTREKLHTTDNRPNESPLVGYTSVMDTVLHVNERTRKAE